MSVHRLENVEGSPKDNIENVWTTPVHAWGGCK